MLDSTELLSLDAEDASVIDFMGIVLAEQGMSQICEAFFWTVYLVLFVFAIRIQIQRGPIRSIPSIVMLIVTCLLFASSTALWVMSFKLFFCRVKTYLRDPIGVPFADRIDKVGEVCITPYALPMEALFLVNMIMGDAVVIWRAWVIWQGARFQRLVFLPMVMLLVSAVFAIIAIQCLATDSFSTRTTISNGSRTCLWGEPIAWAVSLLTNMTSTTLIAVKAWEHRQFLKTANISGSRNERILVVLVESGFVYCLFWLSQVILFLDGPYQSSAMLAYLVLAPMGDQISGVYPTAVIILVSMQRSMALNDSKLFSASDSGPGSGSRSQDRLSTIRGRFQVGHSGAPAKTQTLPGGLEMNSIDMRTGSTLRAIRESSREDLEIGQRRGSGDA